MPNNDHQYDLLDETLNAYAAADRPVPNSYVYQAVAQRAHLDPDMTTMVAPIGVAGAERNVYHRRIRWHQQTLRQMGLLERVSDQRGIWQLTDKAKKGLHPVRKTLSLIAFSTDLGVAIWGHGRDVFDQWPMEQEIMLCFTSPPYPLSSERRYGNPDQSEIVDFIVESMAPVVARLAPEGSLAINLSNDIFLHKQPGRSSYVERIVIGLEDQLGVTLMDRIPWVNLSKPPGPLLYASGTRQQLNVGWEPILWFAKNPLLCKADNRRVLKPHSERHQQLMASGGEQRKAAYGDGAYKIDNGKYGRVTKGAIPKNVLEIGHACSYGKAHRKACLEHNLPTHGAGMPYRVPEFLIKFLTEEGDLVADFFGGRSMTGKAAETLNRRWVTTERIAEYVAGASFLFNECDGYQPSELIEWALHNRQVA